MEPTITPTQLGWCRLSMERTEGVVRFDRRPSGRLVVAELVLASDHWLDSAELRAVPMARIEAWANGPDGEALRLAIKERAELDPTSVDDRERASASQRASWGLSPEAEHDAVALTALPLSRLEVPSTGTKPDSFYEAVADAYGRLGMACVAPAVALAEANGVPVATARSWVKEARRRGLMAPGRRT